MKVDEHARSLVRVLDDGYVGSAAADVDVHDAQRRVGVLPAGDTVHLDPVLADLVRGHARHARVQDGNLAGD